MSPSRVQRQAIILGMLGARFEQSCLLCKPMCPQVQIPDSDRAGNTDLDVERNPRLSIPAENVGGASIRKRQRMIDHRQRTRGQCQVAIIDGATGGPHAP